MSLIVSLKEFVDQLQMQSDEGQAYLNRVTGEFWTPMNDELRAAEEEGFEEDDLDEIDKASVPEWQREAAAKAREILGSNDWQRLPDKFQIHEYSIMRDFCESVEDDDLRADLCDAIRGGGAFRRFKNMADRHGIIEDWYKFRDEAYAEIAKRWLEEHEIAYKP